MSFKRWFLSALAVGAMAAVAVGCNSSSPTPTSVPVGPGATPDAQATIDALARSRPDRTPTATAVPEEERKVVVEFAKGHADISRDWDRFHLEIDTWRQRLKSCDATALQAALSGFAGDFAGVVDAAGSLPRSAVVRHLAGRLTEALEGEARALRELRDGWTPTAPALFEAVEAQRASVAAVQAQVGDELADLRERTREESRTQVRAYSSAVDRLNLAWDTFHQSYDEFRAKEADLSSLEVVDSLSGLIAQLRRNVVEEIRSLPVAAATMQMSEVLGGAAEDEDLALRRLRGTFEKMEDLSFTPAPSDSSSPADSSAPSDSSGPADSSASSSPATVVSFVPRDPTLFDTFDEQLVATNTSRRQALLTLAEILEAASEDREAEVDAFAAEYGDLTAALMQFHRGYDRWQHGEAECDRGSAVEDLGGFSLSFSRIADRARGLPRATLLRPLGELLIEAAERERRALRVLRNGWRPFDSSVYGAFDVERETAGKLRRQVASGLQDLLARYDIPPQEVGP